MKNLTFFYSLFLLIIIGACRPPQLKNIFDYGSVKDGLYINEFFGCSLNIPAGWAVQTREEMEQLQNLGKDMIAGKDKKLKRKLKTSEIRSANLITAFKYKLGTTVEFNPNISIVAENIKFSPGIKSGADYLNHSRELLKQSQFKYDSISARFDQVEFSGKVFSRMFTSVNYMGIPIKQEYYSTIVNGFSFNIVISYSNNEQREELLGMLETLKFE